jgi:hypothetical protein
LENPNSGEVRPLEQILGYSAKVLKQDSGFGVEVFSKEL